MLPACHPKSQGDFYEKKEKNEKQFSHFESEVLSWAKLSSVVINCGINGIFRNIIACLFSGKGFY